MEDQLDNLQQPMQTAIKKRFLNMTLPKGRENLLQKIFQRIAIEKQLRKLKVRLWAALGSLAVTVLLFGFAIDLSLKAFSQTPTFKFVSLFFTDFKLVASNWQDYAFSILETLPLSSLAFLLISLLAFLILGEYAIANFSNLRKASHAHTSLQH